MRLLSREAFDRSRLFLQTQARPLERALFGHRFEGASGEAVLAELACFQNEDGGFGRALEPDLRTPSSSALATADALEILRELACPAEHPMVRGAVAYLMDTFDPEARVWPVAPPDTNAHPHAPWWHDQEGSRARLFDGYRLIPRVEILAHLHHYASLVESEWLRDVTAHTVQDIAAVETLGTGGGADLVGALQLAETETLPQPFKERLVPLVRAAASRSVSGDPQEWGSYCIAPLKLAPSPRSLVADLISELLQAHLDYQIEHQSSAGTWDPTWTWGDFYPDVWPQARVEWQGRITLEALTVLRAFGRLELQ